ncbi:MAG: hypothetical protein IJN13_01440 [Bacilli bacterium]|nr:hypothetical protein [Bacilli bacterium]
MKNKKIVVIIIIILSLITILSITKNNKKYIMRDGMMLALSLDGSSITSFPERGEYEVSVDCGDTAVGKWLAEEWNLAIEDITENIKCNINFSTNPFILKNKVESINTTNNNGYRYSGKQPNNWIWFNREKWRIIGSVPVTLANGTQTHLVKIIRSESIGGLIFDSSATNLKWGSNTLYTLLNTKYYGKVDATGTNPCLGYQTTGYPLCNYEEIGISSSGDDYYGRMIKDVYWNVGAVSDTSTKISVLYTSESETKSSITGKIGLMSASDYGYATSRITYSSVELSSLSSYEQNNWLYGQGNEWTLTPSGSYAAFNLHYDGKIGNALVFYGLAVRPVVYLNSSVYIVSGDGTEGNPYQIAM